MVSNFKQFLPFLKLYNTNNLVKLIPVYIKFSAAAESPTDKMISILRDKFPAAKTIEVVDVSGGCGAMYEVLVESSDFKGLSIVKQHRLINETLKDEIKAMHGVRIHTMVPKDIS